MERFNPDIVTKWGLAQDDSLGDKVKVTILASGFGLYAKKRPKPGKEEVYVSTPEQDDRRNRYYADPRQKQRTRPLVFLFGEEDLCNPEVLRLVEEVPTRLRTRSQLLDIQQHAGHR